jgi:integrase
MKAGYRIRENKLGARPHLKWVVEGKKNGSRTRKFFTTKKEAETYALIKNTELLNTGTEGAAFPLELRAMALSCERDLAPFGKNIRDAVNFYLPHLARMAKPHPVEGVVKEAVASKTADGLRRATLIEFEHRAGHFAKAFPARDIGSITLEEIESWLRGSFPHPVTRNNNRKAVLNLFNFAMSKKYISENPAKQIQKAKEARNEIGILTPDQVSALLTNASPEILPHFAIALFAGIRPDELAPDRKADQGLESSDVKWKQGIIRVRAEVSKVGKPRNVKIEPNLAKWLKPYHKAAGRVSPPKWVGKKWGELFRGARTAAGITDWQDDILRHSYATYWLETHRDAPALAMEMGNSVEVILERYNKVLDEPEDAKLFWAIMPRKKSKVVAAGESPT